MQRLLIQNAILVNEGKEETGSILIEGDQIAEIFTHPAHTTLPEDAKVIDASGKYVLPGIIDDQVHFREPGLTHKGEIYTESKAGVAGGVTSFMEMPNTNPQTTTQKLLQEKFQIASQKSLANYSFYMGATNDNIEELLATDPQNVCGIKIFMGSSTGNMLVDNLETLDTIFKKSPLLIAVHCEDEQTIRKNLDKYKGIYGENIPVALHPVIRNDEACYLSSALAVHIAKKHNTRLHILHLSTAKEIQLLSNKIPAREKRITSEVCVHHLWFDDRDYERLGNKIKWNPAIKSENDKNKLLEALLNGTIDVIATDHAPHTIEEKTNSYFKAPSGGPLLQHSLNVMLELYHQNKISIATIVDKMCHAPAEIFQVKKRGYLRKGYFADLVLVDLSQKWTVSNDNMLYKCGWSPFEGYSFQGKVTHTFINGNMVYCNGKFDESFKGKALTFNR